MENKNISKDKITPQVISIFNEEGIFFEDILKESICNNSDILLNNYFNQNTRNLDKNIAEL